MANTEGIEVCVCDVSRLVGSHTAPTEREAFRFMRRIVRTMHRSFPPTDGTCAEHITEGRWYRTANRIGFEQGRFRATTVHAFRNLQIPRRVVREGMVFTAAWATDVDPTTWTVKGVTEHGIYIVSDKIRFGFPRDHLLTTDDFLRQYVQVCR